MKTLNEESKIAYFSMEIGLSADLPTYSGGLGVLAGDTIKSAADLKLPMIAAMCLHDPHPALRSTIHPER